MDHLFEKGAWTPTESEKDFQAKVSELLIIHGWRVFSIPDSRRVTAKGFPDICCWHPTWHKLVFMELKTEKGRVSPDQKRTLEELGGIVPAYLFRPSDWDTIVKIARGK